MVVKFPVGEISMSTAIGKWRICLFNKPLNCKVH